MRLKGVDPRSARGYSGRRAPQKWLPPVCGLLVGAAPAVWRHVLPALCPIQSLQHEVVSCTSISNNNLAHGFSQVPPT